jgi:hypothetical protein
VNPIARRLEQYTMKYPREVLIVHARVAGEPEQVAIFKGFSSSLMHPTAFDPDVPVLPETAEIESIDRLQGPFNPQAPRYIQQGLSLVEMESLLAAAGL